MKAKIIAAFILGLGVALSGFFIAGGLLKSRSFGRFVQVKGLAEQVVMSDQAIWNIQFKLVNDNLQDLYQEIDAAQEKTRKFLMTQGFKAEEIAANPVTVLDNKSVSYNQNESLPRYAADTGLTVSTKAVSKVEKASQKTGALVQQGIVVTASNAIFRYTALNSIKPDMLIKATKNAQKAAASFAQISNSVLGNIRKAHQGLFTITDANSNYDTGNAIMKKVRVVTTIDYQLK